MSLNQCFERSEQSVWKHEDNLSVHRRNILSREKRKENTIENDRNENVMNL